MQVLKIRVSSRNLGRVEAVFMAPCNAPAHKEAPDGFSDGLPVPSAVGRWKSKTTFY